MSDLTLTVADHTVRIKVEPRILGHIGEFLGQVCPDPGFGTVALITDETVGSLYAPAVLDGLRQSDVALVELRVPAGERSKSLKVLADVYRWLADNHVGRDGLILALGGGVVSDLAGFAAATWMRGIRFAICPTTLESAIDASIGGKTAVNIPGAKNLIGAFHQPLFVATDPTCLSTLEPREISAGMAESIKHALIADAEFLGWHEAHADAMQEPDASLLTELIVRNARIKCSVVERDPFERSGDRMILNFGHTIGHAIESSGGYELRHGECVALGMLAACRLSQVLGLVESTLVDRVAALLVRFDLPTQLERAPDTDTLLESIRKDKKAKGKTVRFVLLEDVGRPVIRDDVSPQQMREAIETLRP